MKPQRRRTSDRPAVMSVGRNRRQQALIGELWMRIRDHKKLARILVIQEVSHRELAEAAGWKSHSIVGRIVRGELDTIEPERALRIAEFLQTPVDDLFEIKVSSISGHRVQRTA